MSRRKRILLIEKFIPPTYVDKYGNSVWTDRYGNKFYPNKNLIPISFVKSNWTVEMAQDVRMFYNIDAEAELEKLLVAELTAEFVKKNR